MWKVRNRNRRAFTIIELIVVIAILGILVLLGMPKILGYTAKAQLMRIQHDTKIMQDKMEEVFSDQDVAINEWPKWNNNEKDLGMLILKKQLYETEGLVRRLDKSHIKFPKYNWENVEGKIYSELMDYKAIDEEAYADLNNIQDVLGIGGTLVMENLLTQNDDGHGYKVIPEKYKSDIKTRLDGTFYSNAQGKVYYEPNKPLTDSKSEIAPSCSATPEPDYTFEHLSGTIVKYHGTAQYLVIPEAFLVEGKCWPVRIIGAGTFQRGDFPRDTPIKGVVIPPGVEEIEEDAFKDNEIESVMLPPGVKDVHNEAFDPGVSAVYKPSIDKELGLIVKPNMDSGGNIITGSSGRPTGTINSGGWGSRGSSASSSGGSGSGAGSSGGSGSSAGSSGGSGSNSGGAGSGIGGKVIVIPDIIIVDGVEVEIVGIEQGAFQGEGLIHVTLPSGLERIEDYAFAGNQLIGINIPEKVKYIGNYAFAFNELSYEKIYKWTINYINFKKEEQIRNVNKKIGNIEKDGFKVTNLLGSTLLDHIFVTSIGNIVIDIVPENKKPIAVITMNPKRALLPTTKITWGYEGSRDPNGLNITEYEWMDAEEFNKAGNHTVKLRVKNEKGIWSNWAKQDFIVHSQIIPPSIPGLFIVNSEPKKRGNSIDIEWNHTINWGKPEAGQNYRLEYRYNSKGDFELLDNLGSVNKYTHNIPMSTKNSSVEYRVRAENEQSESAWRTISYQFETPLIVRIDTLSPYTIEEEGFYQITARGAQGGYGGNYSGSTYRSGGAGGEGALISGVFELNKGDVIYIIPGQKGINGTNGTDRPSPRQATSGGAGGQITLRLNVNDINNNILSAKGGAGGGRGGTSGNGANGVEGNGGGSNIVHNGIKVEPGLYSVPSNGAIIEKWYE